MLKLNRAIAFCLTFFPSIAFPASPHLSFGTEHDIVSQYIWHGIALSEGTVLQSSGYLEYYGVGVSVWSNLVLNNESNQGNVNEIDYTLYYAGEWNDFSFQPAVTFYTYPSDDTPHTGELLVRLAYTFGAIEVFSDTSVDFIEYDGALFVDGGIGISRKLVGSLSIDASALVGMGNATFNRAYLADVGNQANLAEVSLALPIDVWQGLTVTPHLHFSSLIAEELRDAVADEGVVWGGVKIGVQF